MCVFRKVDGGCQVKYMCESVEARILEVDEESL